MIWIFLSIHFETLSNRIILKHNNADFLIFSVSFDNLHDLHTRAHTHKSLNHKQDVTQGQFLSTFQRAWIKSVPSPRFVAMSKLKSSNNGSWTVGCILITRVLALCNMQTASFRVWTRFFMSISFDNKWPWLPTW